VDGGMLWRNGCDGKVLRCGAGNRHQQAIPQRTHKFPFGCNGYVTVMMQRPWPLVKAHGFILVLSQFASSVPQIPRRPGVHLETGGLATHIILYLYIQHGT
jgi:hypothetical protein